MVGNKFKRFIYNPYVARIIVRLLAKLHHASYSLIGSFASAAEGGLHPKHRIMNYHKFFLDNVSVGDSILDVGCGNGFLLADLSRKAQSLSVGIDISEENIQEARRRLADMTNAKVFLDDIWNFDDNQTYNVIILSNVLEHLDRRPELLRRLKVKFKPNKLLVRVPVFDREWLVPYKKELGVEWRLDSTHEIEYTDEILRSELAEGGYSIKEITWKWGELYAVAIPY